MTYIVGLRQLADYIEKSTGFNQCAGASCTIGRALQLSGDLVRDKHSAAGWTAPGLANDGVRWIDRGAQVLGISREEAEAIWDGRYPNRSGSGEWQPTQDIAVAHLRQLADKYQPVEPEPKKLEPMPILVRELVPA